ncbi:MAG: hypothetical protein JNK30_10035 [Phenylobacterium sp.]|uniref:hypothetical protein n=1 Tax=Phenylobacterium sp. TaxID=1871053 RepID=UPI001A3C4E53|nr:hypothetical protein [Phenylobacterium sp.]MBL8771708.1 hypothetical protein [Phenylobacterium sp.]
MRRLILFAAVAGLAACSPGKGGAPGAKFNTEIPMNEFMGHFVDPAAFMIWKNSGTMVDEKGEHSLYPTTDEGWDVLVTGATMLVEAGNVLQMPGRTRAPEADWNKYSRMLSERAMLARAAAEKHDEKAVFDEGGRIYEVCVACHEQFVIEPQMKAQGPAEGDPLPAAPEKK